MMTDPRSLSDPRMGLPGDPRTVMSADPRAVLHGDPRAAADPRLTLGDARSLLSACTCGLPNCPRVHHHPGQHAMTLAPETHLATTHGLTGLPLGASPVGHVDPALLYQMGAAYGLGDSPDAMRSLPQLSGYYPYDPTTVYPYINGYAGIDARRKNATKESTNTLKAWLYEHRKNPYPTKGEKIMLAILTKMTLTQVSTWFANARRRLKKDNKVTWVTKDGDIDDDDDDVNSEHNSDITDGANISGNSAGDENNRHHGSVGDDDDNLSIISGGDRSEIDVEEHSEFGDDDPRVPPMLSHTLPHGLPHGLPGLPHMYLGNHPHNMTSSGHPAVSFGQHTSSSQTDQSKTSNPGLKLDNTLHNGVSRDHSRSPERKSPNAISAITPPPSPGDARHSQSASSSHTSTSHVHQSSATIHHHPVTSSRISSSSSTSLQSSSSSPTKAKIWSIADVVSSKASDKPDSKPEITSSHSHTYNHMSSAGISSPIVSLGGAQIRPGGMPQGVVVPGADGPYSLAYYPYGLPHPTAAAMMASQMTSHMRIPHPYSRSVHALSGQPTSGREHPILNHPGFNQPRVLVSSPPQKPGDLHRSEETRRPEISHTQHSPRLGDQKCTPTAFMPVPQRQV